MIPASRSLGPRTAAAALAAGMLLGGCYYYGYPAYPTYPGSPVVGAAYTQQEFTVPAQAASGTAAAGAPAAALPAGYEYAVGPSADYYQTYPYPYPYSYYPPYAGYPAYYGYGYPPVSFASAIGTAADAAGATAGTAVARLAWRQQLARWRWRRRLARGRRPRALKPRGSPALHQMRQSAGFFACTLHHCNIFPIGSVAGLARACARPLSFPDNDLADFARQLARIWLRVSPVCRGATATTLRTFCSRGIGHDGLRVFPALDAGFARLADHLGVPSDACRFT